MRRDDKEITDPELVWQIIGNCQVCRLALAKDNVPYIVPVAFGVDGEAIYFHTAREGSKLEFIAANDLVCVEFEHGVELKTSDSSPCRWTFSFQSVIGYGRVRELTGHDAKVAGLDRIMAHYSDRPWEYRDTTLKNVRVWKLTIESLSGKQSKDKATS